MRNWLYLAGIVVTIAVASHFAFAPERAGTKAFFYIMAVPTLVIAGIGIYRAHRDGVLKDLAGVKGGDFTRGFAAAALLFGVAYTFTKTVTTPTAPQAVWLVRLYEHLGDPSDLRKNVGGVILGLVVIGLAEEIVWRGLVTSLLEEQIGSRRAWVWAAVLYAVAHVPTMWQLKVGAAGMNPVVVIAALGCGLTWGFMARRFGRLMPGIFAHVLFDWVIVMMFRLWGPSV